MVKRRVLGGWCERGQDEVGGGVVSFEKQLSTGRDEEVGVCWEFWSCSTGSMQNL